MTDYATIATLAFFALAEPLLVLYIAPRLTSQRVRKDAVGIIESEMIPRIKTLVEEALGLAEAKETEERGLRLSRSGVESRQEFRAQEEMVMAAVLQQSPAAAVLLEQAKGLMPTAYKTAVRAGPEAVLALAQKLGGLAGKQQQVGAYL